LYFVCLCVCICLLCGGRIKIVKSFVGWGFAPDQTGGAYSAPPDPLAVFRGLFLKGREGKGEEGKKGREDERERR